MKNKAFTLVELLVVIAIIGLIASISIIALGNARSKSRDSKRVSDIKQVQSALELFFSDQGRYPTVAEWNSGSLYATGTFGTTTYLERIPTASLSGDCTNGYTYAPNTTSDNYTINFCLENKTGSLEKGLNFAKANSSGTKDDSLVGWWDANIATNTTFVLDKAGNNNHLTLYNGATIIQNCRKAGEACLDFDGVNDKGVISTQNLVLNMGYDEITFMTWVNVKQSTTYPVLFSNRAGCGGAGWGIAINSATFQSSILGTGAENVLGSGSLGVWRHITIVFSRSSIKGYSNGSLLTSVNYSNGPGNVYSSLNIPGTIEIASCFEASYASVQMADVRIYKKVLNNEEISAIYNSTR